MKVKWDYYSQYMENIKCSKAPTSYGDGLRKNSPFQMPVDPHGPSGGDYD
jgi:hypothetical protein